MNILAFDTSFGACSVAVGIGFGGLQPSTFHRCEPMETGHAERLVPMIGEVMSEAGLAFTGLDRIAVTAGPGTFTGSRTGIAAARALALSIGCPTVGLSSLEVIAAGVCGSVDRVAVVVDARRSEVYLQLFDRPTGATLCPPRIVSTIAAAHIAFEGRFTLAGTGSAAVAAAAGDHGLAIGLADPGLLPSAEHMLALAACAAPAQEPLRPLYLRAPDAKPQPVHGLRRATS